MIGLLVVGLVAVGAITMDMTRLGTLRAELQNAADAGAHSGAIQLLLPGSTPSEIVDSTVSYAVRNTALQVVPTVDLAETGIWDPGTATFTPTVTAPNAVRIQLSVTPVNLIMELVGVNPPVVHASAIGSSAPGPPPHPAIVK